MLTLFLCLFALIHFDANGWWLTLFIMICAYKVFSALVR